MEETEVRMTSWEDDTKGLTWPQRRVRSVSVDVGEEEDRQRSSWESLAPPPIK